GYNIQDAMRLRKKRCKYNAFCAIACQLSHKYLDVSKTLCGQDQYVVTMVLCLAQEEYQCLRKYPNNWPLHDLIA
ncbi:hypothetical protein PAXRUDRAFT_152246, partial [Paxillus rubicundulus Ve08.2h10]